VRLIAATNRDLSAMVAGGTFREDLFFRLHVVPLTMPPLRNHPEDIPLLTSAFLKEMAREHGKPQRRFSVEAMAALESYGWPGNIRELKAAVEHAVVLGIGEELGISDLPSGLQAARSAPPSGDLLNLAEAEESLIRKALADSGGNRTMAAKKLGISRRTLHRHLSQLGIFKHLH
jgi:DNA-binding NtrC family response regulator